MYLEKPTANNFEQMEYILPPFQVIFHLSFHPKFDLSPYSKKYINIIKFKLVLKNFIGNASHGKRCHILYSFSI
jgi:hypothetical protein